MGIRKIVFVRNDGIFFRLIRGKWTILMGDKASYMELNNEAGLLWELLERERSHEYLVAQLTKKFQVSTGQADKDIARFLEDYLKRGLIKKLSL